jgi:energy-converting hydrogenase Eha subunit C
MIPARTTADQTVFARIVELRFLRVASAAAAFDPLGYAIEDFDALHRVASHRRFAAEHDRVCLLEDCVCHSR